jgi:phage-related protein
MQKDKEVIWEGDSLKELKKFPDKVKVNIGGDLRRLQEGKAPLDSKPMTSIGSGVYELRDSDSNGWYRTIYYTKFKERIYILHSFVKKSAKTPRKDLNLADERLKNVKARIALEKKNEKK